MLFGSVPTPPKKPQILNQDPVGEAQEGGGDDSHPRQSWLPTDPRHQQTCADQCHRHDHEEVHAPAVGGVEASEPRHHRTDRPRLRRPAHVLHHRRQAAPAPPVGSAGPARPAAWPTLQQRHRQEERTRCRSARSGRAAARPARTVRKRHQEPGECVEQHRPGCRTTSWHPARRSHRRPRRTPTPAGSSPR